MEFPPDLRYTEQDEWLRLEGDNEVVIGITDYAQDALGDVVYVELPTLGRVFRQGEPFGLVESVKAVSDLYAPVGGEVIARNDGLERSPELLNQSPYTDGWIIRLRIADASEIGRLLTAEDYRARCETETA